MPEALCHVTGEACVFYERLFELAKIAKTRDEKLAVQAMKNVFIRKREDRKCYGRQEVEHHLRIEAHCGLEGVAELSQNMRNIGEDIGFEGISDVNFHWRSVNGR